MKFKFEVVFKELTLENIETDTAKLVDIWVIDLCQKADLGGSHGVVVWKKELEFEDAT